MSAGSRPALLRYLSRWMLPSSLVFLVLALVVGVGHQRNGVDTCVANSVHQWIRHRSAFASAARTVTFLGSTACLVTVTLVVAALLIVGWSRIRPAVVLVVTATTVSGVESLVKVLVARPRPHFSDALASAPGYSFPSGHAANSTAVYGTAALILFASITRPLARRVAYAATVILVLAIATSRVALGVHWLSDVIAGIALAMVGVAAAGWALHPSQGVNGPRSEPSPITSTA